MFVAANAVGKTAVGANILANIVYGVQNKYFEFPFFYKFPYIKRGRIISDPTTIKEKIIPELQKWFPANESKIIPDANYETSKAGKNYESKFITKTGFEIDIMSTEQDAKEFESVDLGFVWIDEPMPRDKFLATVARGRLGMIIIWTYTPLFYSGWIKDWMDEHSGEAQYIEGEVEDNCIVHGTRGILEHHNIVRMANSYPEDEKQARIFGKFGHMIGRVHKKFSRKIHVIKAFPIDEKKFTVYHALDTHPRVPDHALWLAVNARGTKYVCGELLSEGGVQLLSERIKAFEFSHRYRMEDRLIDPSAYINDQHHDEKPSIAGQLDAFNLRYIGGSKDLSAGIKRTDDAFAYEMKGNEMIIAPEVYIFDTCPITIKQLEEYVWDEYHGRGADDREKKARPKDKNDHQPENLHRLLLHEPSFVPYVFDRSGDGGSMREEERNLDPY